MFALFDAHCDTAGAIYNSGESLFNNTLHTDLERGKIFSRRGQVYAIWQHANGLTQSELTSHFWKIFNNLLLQIELNSNVVTLCTSAGDIYAAFASNRQAALVSCEGAELFGCDEKSLALARKMGLRILNLCWNSDNALCGAAMDSGKGLTKKGKNFVRFCSELGIIIDLSHASDATACDVLDLGCANVLASHSNCRAVNNHPRNLPDELLRDIGRSGGVIGLNLYPPFLGGHDPVLIADHAKHLIEICGEDAVCLGCDFDGVDELPSGVHGIKDMQFVFDVLLSSGVPRRSAEDIFFNNLMNFWERVL